MICVDVPSCKIPSVPLGLIDEAGELIAFETTRGAQLLALVMAKAANDEPVKVVPLRRP